MSSDLLNGPKKQMIDQSTFQGQLTRALMRSGVEGITSSLVAEDVTKEGIEELYASTFKNQNPSAPEITKGFKSWSWVNRILD